MHDSKEQSVTQKLITPVKLAFFFAGTGDVALNYQRSRELEYTFDDDVIRIYISGCQHPKVGNSEIAPNLEIIANNIQKSFEEDKSLNIKKLKETLGDAIKVVHAEKYLEAQSIPIESITLEGFSRGAVTTFAVAKKIDSLEIPIDIIANQPVPGETSEGSRLYAQYHDLSACKNIRSATTILATHDLRNGPLHDIYFKQMIAEFNEKTPSQQFLVPTQSHLQSYNYPIVKAHISLYLTELGLVKQEVQDCKTLIKNYYKHMYISKNVNYFCSFTPKPFLQKILGASNIEIPKDPYYLEVYADEALNILTQNAISSKPTGLYDFNDEQAHAIVVVNTLALTLEEKSALYPFIYDNSPQAQQFIGIINHAQEMTEYLYARTLDYETETKKSEQIKINSKEYLTKIAKESHQYLKLENPSDGDKQNFIAAIVQAEIDFRKKALSISRVVCEKIPIISIFIAEITKLINYYTKTYSERLIIQTSEQMASAAGIENFKKLKSAIMEKTSQTEEAKTPKGPSKH